MRRVLALAGYAIRANLAMPFTWAGGLLVFAVALLGPIFSLRNHGTWTLDADLLGTGLAFGSLFVIRSGLVEQRTGGLQDFLRVNLISPLAHIAAAMLSLIASWLLLCAWAWVVGVALSLGDVRAVTWTVWNTLLVLGLLLPFAFMVECASDLRTPIVIPGFVWFAVLITLATALDPMRASALLGLNGDPAWFPSSLPLAARAAASFAGGFALVLAGTALRGRTRRARLRAARTAA